MPAADIPFLHAMAGRDGEMAATLLVLFSFFVVLALLLGQRFIGKLFVVSGAHSLRFGG